MFLFFPKKSGEFSISSIKYSDENFEVFFEENVSVLIKIDFILTQTIHQISQKF